MATSDQSATDDKTKQVGWEHFPHDADVGIRGFGPTREAAFEQGALALMHVITDLDHVRPQTLVEISCEADKLDVLFVEWLNALIFEIATTKMLLSRFCRADRGFEAHRPCMGRADRSSAARFDHRSQGRNLYGA